MQDHLPVASASHMQICAFFGDCKEVRQDSRKLLWFFRSTPNLMPWCPVQIGAIV